MKIYNFSAGPACLPEPVLNATQKAAIEYKGTGMSVMEMSHRSEPIVDLFHETTSRVRELLDVPSNYHVLWLQGGASMQFAMVPMNLLSNTLLQIISKQDPGLRKRSQNVIRWLRRM